MLLGRVEGQATSTIKHASLRGWRMMVIQPVQVGAMEPLLAIDALGCRVGDLVVISNDGRGAREMVGDDRSPVRWAVVGVMDYEDWHAG